jgi:LacI family transcriptional regulator
MKDIARDLNLSLITVSKALRGNTDISDATRERVLNRVRELGYKPNMMARSLATGRSFIMGLIMPDLLSPYLTELAQSLVRVLRREGYALIVASSEADPQIERSEIAMMLARGVDALLLVSCQSSPEVLLDDQSHHKPIVLVDRPLPHLRASFVGSDDRAGGKRATDHLLDLGRRRLAYIGSPDLSPAAERYRGFREALRHRKIPLRKEFVLPSSRFREADLEGYEMMQKLIELSPRPDAVFCHNDVIAIGAMRAALNAGLSIPDDIAFVGFDDVRFSRYLPIPLTSIDQRTAEIGARAAGLALALVKKKGSSPTTILLEPNLVVRNSSVAERICPRPAHEASLPRLQPDKKPRRTIPPR